MDLFANDNNKKRNGLEMNQDYQTGESRDHQIGVIGGIPVDSQQSRQSASNGPFADN
jgi:hypothetical protein